MDESLIIYFTDGRNAPRWLNLSDYEGKPVEAALAPEEVGTFVVFNNVSIQWDEAPRATGYNLYLNGEKYNNDPIVDTTFYSITELAEGEYSVSITTINGEMESAFSNSANFVIATKPKNLTYVGTTQTLFWDVVTDAAGYNVYIDGVKYNSELIETADFVLEDLVQEQDYFVFVRAAALIDEEYEEGVQSDHIEITFILRPEPPTDVAVEVVESVAGWFNNTNPGDYSPLTSLPDGWRVSGLVHRDGIVYIWNPYNGSAYTDKMYAYDIATGVTTEIGNISGDRGGDNQSTFVRGNTIVRGAHYGASTGGNGTISAYDLATNTITELYSNTNHSGGSMAWDDVNDVFYLYSGQFQSGVKDQVVKYDPNSGTATLLNDLPAGFDYGIRSHYYQGQVYLYHNNNEAFGIHHIDTDTYTVLSFPTGQLIDYLWGQDGILHAYCKDGVIRQYDEDSDSWSILLEAPATIQTIPMAVPIDGDLWAFGGQVGGVETDIVQVASLTGGKAALATWTPSVSEPVDGYNVYLKSPAENQHSLSFDGVDDYVDLDGNILDGQDVFTIETLAFIEEDESDRAIFTAGGIELFIGANGTLYFALYNGTEYKYGAYTGIAVNQWVHIAGVYDGSTIKVYVNAIEGERSDELLFNVFGSNNASAIGIHRSFNTGAISDYFKGKIDEVKVWSIARSQQELEDGMFLILEGTEEGLISYYRFEEGSGSSASDETGTNEGVISGATYSEDVADEFTPSFEKQNSSLIEANEYTIQDLADGSYQAYVTAVKNGLESEPSEIVAFSVIPQYSSNGTIVVGRDYDVLILDSDLNILTSFTPNVHLSVDIESVGINNDMQVFGTNSWPSRFVYQLDNPVTQATSVYVNGSTWFERSYSAKAGIDSWFHGFLGNGVGPAIQKWSITSPASALDSFGTESGNQGSAVLPYINGAFVVYEYGTANVAFVRLDEDLSPVWTKDNIFPSTEFHDGQYRFGLDVDINNNVIVAHTNNIQKYNEAGDLIWDFDIIDASRVKSVHCLPNGDFLVACFSGVVRRYTAGDVNNDPTMVWEATASRASRVVSDWDSYCYAVGSSAIYKIDLNDGSVITSSNLGGTVDALDIHPGNRAILR